MIVIDKLVDKLHAVASEAVALMSAGKMNAAASAAEDVSRLAKVLGSHPDIEGMSDSARAKLSAVETVGDMLTAQFRERGIVQ